MRSPKWRCRSRCNSADTTNGSFRSGEMVLSTWDSPGEGTYYHSGGTFIATGKGGLA